MKHITMKILPIELLEDYKSRVSKTLDLDFEKLVDNALPAGNFSFYTSVSAVFSSKIEGESIELDSFLKHKMQNAKFLPDYTQKIDDLYDAYVFAQKMPLNLPAVKKTHTIITRNILQKATRGRVRTGNMFVMTADGKIEYVACEPGKVKKDLKKLFDDIALLMDAELTIQETFFFAALIHLVFVKIHPFEDGNGRTARLLEKWFLAKQAGEKGWFVQSEKYYYEQHDTYYSDIRRLGLAYDLLDYKQAMSSLLMLAEALSTDHAKHR
jgi:Fic family protein